MTDSCQHYNTHVEKEDKEGCYLCKRICNLCGSVIETWIEAK
jgi:hypothetical protein